MQPSPPSHTFAPAAAPASSLPGLPFMLMLTFDFTAFPVLSTERLVLRQLTSADAPAIFALRSDPLVMQYIPRSLPASVADAAVFIEQGNEAVGRNEMLSWGIARHSAAEIVGTIGYYHLQPEHHRAEIGYMLRPAYQGQGFMREAVAAVLAYGFETLCLHSVAGVIDPQNEASAQVLKHAGFVQEGFFRENEFWEGKFLDTAFYSLLCPASRETGSTAAHRG